MVAKTFGGAVHGVDARTIMIEVSVGQGTRFFMSGLPDNAVKESQHRVESALKAASFFMPRNKTVVNLAPADIRKEGSAYDLPIALCVLKSWERLHSMVNFVLSKVYCPLPFRRVKKNSKALYFLPTMRVRPLS